MGEPLYDFKLFLPMIRNILLPTLRVKRGVDLFDTDKKRPRKPFALVVPSEIFKVCSCSPRII